MLLRPKTSFKAIADARISPQLVTPTAFLKKRSKSQAARANSSLLHFSTPRPEIPPR